MPSTYSSRLRFELIADGEQSGTWGQTTNRNTGTLVETAIAGYRTIALADANYTLTTSNGLDDDARYAMLNFTGTLTATRDITAPAVSKLYVVKNQTNQTLNVKTAAGAARAVPAGKTVMVFIDGTDAFDIANDLTALSTGNLSYSGTLTGGTGVINIGSGQIYKDAVGSIGFGTTTPGAKVNAVGGTGNGFLYTASNGVNTIIGESGTAGYAGTLSNHPMTLYTNGTEKFRIDTAGNAGLGATPSDVQAGTRVFQIRSIGSITADAATLRVRNNAYLNTSGVDTYTTSNFASDYAQNAGRHLWFTAPSGTAGNPITFTQAMTLTQGGNLLVGTTVDSPGYKFRVNANDGIIATLGGATANINIANTVSNEISLIGGGGDALILGSNDTERARITSGGYFKASNTGVYENPTLALHEFVGSDAFVVIDSGVAATGGDSIHRANIKTANAYARLYQGVNGGAITYEVNANGDVRNTNNSYGAISDATRKENIVDVASYLDRFMQVRFRNFNFIGSDLKQFGVIAQELETVFPGLVDESPDMELVTKTRTVEVPAVEEVLDEEGNVVTPAQPATTREEEYTESVPTGTVTKSVKYSILAQIQGKVIQEQHAIITAQQAQIDSILARLTALEAK